MSFIYLIKEILILVFGRGKIKNYTPNFMNQKKRNNYIVNYMNKKDFFYY